MIIILTPLCLHLSATSIPLLSLPSAATTNTLLLVLCTLALQTVCAGDANDSENPASRKLQVGNKLREEGDVAGLLAHLCMLVGASRPEHVLITSALALSSPIGCP